MISCGAFFVASTSVRLNPHNAHGGAIFHHPANDRECKASRIELFVMSSLAEAHISQPPCVGKGDHSLTSYRNSLARPAADQILAKKQFMLLSLICGRISYRYPFSQLPEALD
jgi:hypothetical protein